MPEVDLGLAVHLAPQTDWAPQHCEGVSAEVSEGLVAVAAAGTASGTLNNGAAASGPGAGTPAGPGLSPLSGAISPYAFASSGGHAQPRELSSEEKEKLERLDQVLAAMDRQLSSKLRICKGC